MRQRNKKSKTCLLIRHLAAVFALALLFVTVAKDVAIADENWSEAYYRAVDLTKELSEAQRNDLDEGCIEFMKTYHLDCSLLCTYTERYADSSLEQLAIDAFRENEFGYGEGKDGFSVAFDAENHDVVIVPMGAAEGVIDQNYLDFIAETVPKYQEEYGNYGPLYASLRMLSKEMEKLQGEKQEQLEAEVDAQETGEPEEVSGQEEELLAELDAEAQEGQEQQDEEQSEDQPQRSLIAQQTTSPGEVLTGNKLYLYIEENPNANLTRGETDPETDADESRTRVTDRADLLTDEQESILNERLYEIRKEIGKDLVVLTDTSSYGKEHSDYSADFYDYNGYGCGREFEGAVLFICMDPNDRGFWTCCTGRQTKEAYTQYYANQTDDMLYFFAKNSLFYEGISDWAENMRRLLRFGNPFAYEWMSGSVTEGSFDAQGLNIVDDGHLLLPDEIAKLDEKAKNLSKAYDLDVIVHTAYNTGELEVEEFADRFYKAYGFGNGQDHSGILLTVVQRPDYYPTVHVSTYGRANDVAGGVGPGRLASRCESSCYNDSSYAGIDFGLDMAKSLLAKGRVPRSAGSWIASIIFELILGLIFGSIMFGKAKKKMDTPKVETNATAYLVKGSLSVQNISDTFIDSKITKTRKHTETRSSSGGSSSSSRSSYKSSYSSSSGRSHSGSGRSF